MTKGAKASSAMCGSVAGQWCHSRSGRRLLINGTESRVEKSLNCSSTISATATTSADHPLPEELGARGKAQAAPLDHLDVVVGKADGAEGRGWRRP